MKLIKIITLLLSLSLILFAKEIYPNSAKTLHSLYTKTKKDKNTIWIFENEKDRFNFILLSKSTIQKYTFSKSKDNFDFPITPLSSNTFYIIKDMMKCTLVCSLGGEKYNNCINTIVDNSFFIPTIKLSKSFIFLPSFTPQINSYKILLFSKGANTP